MSDCLYKEAPWEKLMETILFFSEKNPEMEIIFAYKKRYVYQEYFLNEAGILQYIIIFFLYFIIFLIVNFLI